MHICLITPSFPPQVDGGVAISTGRLAERLLRMGHHVTVLTSLPPVLPDASVNQPMPRLEHLSIHYGLTDTLQLDSATIVDLCHWAQARHSALPFDVILAYFVYPGGFLATLLGERLNLPVVCSCRGNDISKDIFIHPETVARVLTRSTRLIFVCASLLRMADTLMPCRAKSTIIPNAVDTTQFRPAPWSDGRTRQRVTLGTSGVMRWKKGLDLFLPLIDRLCTTHQVQVVIAGYGLDTLIDLEINDFLHTHDLHRRVELTGPVPHREMVQVLQRMHLYVNTAYQEGMPNGVLEAMACALPVVATDADGTQELVEDGSTGYLCRMGDLEMLTDRCQRLIEQPVMRRQMGLTGRQRVRDHFHPNREARAIEAVLRQACMNIA